MASGPGKYDGLATQAREQAKAAAVIVVVLGGEQGSGFSVQTADPALALELPRILREIATGIESDVQS